MLQLLFSVVLLLILMSLIREECGADFSFSDVNVILGIYDFH